MEEKITLEFIEQTGFTYDGLFKDDNKKKEKHLYKMPDSHPLPPSDDDKSKVLRKELNNVIDHKFTTLVSAAVRSEIPESTFKAYMNGTRKFQRYALAKICIAAQLTVAEAQGLFKYTEHSLDPDNCLLDAVLFYCLKNHEPISELERVMRSKGVNV